MIKLVVLYGEPKSPAEFEKYYADVHLPIAAQMKGVRRIELSKATRTPEGARRRSAAWLSSTSTMPRTCKA